MECRRVVEVGAAGLAAERATPEQIAEMERGARRLGDAVSRGVPWAEDEDLSFHLAVAAAAGNSVLLSMTQMLAQMTLCTHLAGSKLRSFDKAHLQAALERHQGIYTAVRDRDPDGAMEAMKIHFDVAQREMFEE